MYVVQSQQFSSSNVDYLIFVFILEFIHKMHSTNSNANVTVAGKTKQKKKCVERCEMSSPIQLIEQIVSIIFLYGDFLFAILSCLE